MPPSQVSIFTSFRNQLSTLDRFPDNLVRVRVFTMCEMRSQKKRRQRRRRQRRRGRRRRRRRPSQSRPLSKQRPQWRFDNLNLIAHFFFLPSPTTSSGGTWGGGGNSGGRGTLPWSWLSLSFKLDSFQSRFWFPLLPPPLSSPIKHDDGDR